VSDLESINIRSELVYIKSQMLIGPYDGVTLKTTVDSFNARLQSVEQIVGAGVEQIIDVPDIIRRLNNIESALSSGKKTQEFVVASGNLIFVLFSSITLDSQRVFVDGVYVNEGLNEDYVIAEDRRTLTFNIPLLDGSVVLVEYY
jgi:hypothetical protein